jgi:hypothetical protein
VEARVIPKPQIPNIKQISNPQISKLNPALLAPLYFGIWNLFGFLMLEICVLPSPLSQKKLPIIGIFCWPPLLHLHIVRSYLGIPDPSKGELA